MALAFDAPRVGNLFGVWRVEGSSEIETYRTASDGGQVRESRTHAGIGVSDWLSGRVRYSMSAGVDAWNTGQRATSAGGSIERRWLADRLATAANGTVWMPAKAGAAFGMIGTTAHLQSSKDARIWSGETTIGVERVSDAAPMTLWPGAGDGHARAPLLRAHPLLDDGVIDAARGVFGRTLAYGTAEVRRWLAGPAPARVGIAAFVDVARSSRQATSGLEMWQADVGAGLRLRVPGWQRTLRVDAAYGLRDGATAIGIGWLF